MSAPPAGPQAHEEVNETEETLEMPPNHDRSFSRGFHGQDVQHRHPSPKASNPLSLHVLALLIPSSILGTLARLGLTALATYDGSSIFPLAYAQATGCLVMGIAMGFKDSLGHFYPPVYTAITTGFCGSLTTFSGWQLDIFHSWINASQFHRGGFRDFIDGMGKSVFTLSISLASVSLGVRLASIMSPYAPNIPPPNSLFKFILTFFSIASYAAVFPAYFLLPAEFRHQATAALLFAFPGTLTRYILSVQFNTLLKAIPFGTFMANSIGTAILAGLMVLENKTHHVVTPSACSILQGLSDGYCGCLTTVSTFAAEVRGMKPWNAFRYALISWSVGQLLSVLILGSSIWSGHAEEQKTCIFN